MNEKLWLNKAMFIFAIQLCFEKILNFLTQMFGFGNHVWFDKQQTKKTSVHFSCQEREKKWKMQTINH
jgi:hypothetical protein